MRTIRAALILSLIGVAPVFAQEATPGGATNGSTAAAALAATTPKPPAPRRRFRLVRAAVRIARDVQAETGVALAVPRTVIDNEIVVGAAVGLGLGGLAFQDCDARVSPCTAAILTSAGVGAVSGAIVRAHRKH